ncbi:uncharacterized protein PFLUO_LOCUS8168 [Penicillium psychrofluorescens]|uniref:uncharacterized protein n=1 Tax=Penicillium psychrofluorescens TaxID=3158075 RepID=UPI003CCE48EA
MAIGTASAIAQHVVFRHYDYQAVRSSTEQKWIGRVGTGLAFLCKTLLATACNTAYVQYLWMLARVRPASVSSLDAMYDVLSNALSFSQLAVWTKRPFLLLIAIISWLLPLAALVTPSALSVMNIPHITHKMLPVPQLDFNAPIYADLYVQGTGGFQGPNILLSRLFMSSATAGQILSIPPPSQNSSYILDFHGPGLSCKDMENPTLAKEVVSYGQESVYYKSWVGPSVAYEKNTSRASADSELDYVSGDSSKLWLAVFNMTTFEPRFTKCALTNISYSVSFTFEAGEQSVNVLRVHELNGVPTRSDTSDMTQAHLAYQSMMAMINKLMVGGISNTPGGSLIYSDGTLIQATNLGQLNPLCSNLATNVNGDTPGKMTDQFFGACQNTSLAAAMETLFQNMTLSLLNNEYFW